MFENTKKGIKLHIQASIHEISARVSLSIYVHVCIIHVHVCIMHVHVCIIHVHVCIIHVHVCIIHVHVCIMHVHVCLQDDQTLMCVCVCVKTE